MDRRGVVSRHRTSHPEGGEGASGLTGLLRANLSALINGRSVMLPDDSDALLVNLLRDELGLS